MAQATTVLDLADGAWDAVADAYREHATPVTRRFAPDALDEALLPRGARVLDVGAGTGALALEAAARGMRVAAVDRAPRMVELLRSQAAADAVGADVMDAHALDLPDDAFDAAFATFALPFFDDASRALREMRRVVRPGGRAVVAVWGAPDRVDPYGALLAAWPEFVRDLPFRHPPALRFGRAGLLRAEMEQAGLRGVEVRAVTRTWASTPEGAWATLAADPLVGWLQDRLALRAQPFRAAVVERFRRRAVDGRVHLRAEALVAVGRA